MQEFLRSSRLAKAPATHYCANLNRCRMKASLSEQSVFIKSKHHIVFLGVFLCQRSLEKQTLRANKNHLWRVLLSLCCNKGSVLRSLPLHKFYTAVGFVSLLRKLSPGWHKEKNPRRQCSDEGRIKTLLYLRAGEFRATSSAADEGETKIDGGTIFPRKHGSTFSIRSGRIQLDFYRPRLPLCPTELDVVSVARVCVKLWSEPARW